VLAEEILHRHRRAGNTKKKTRTPNTEERTNERTNERTADSVRFLLTKTSVRALQHVKLLLYPFRAGRACIAGPTAFSQHNKRME
jgi:hypothetical protein